MREEAETAVAKFMPHHEHLPAKVALEYRELEQRQPLSGELTGDECIGSLDVL